MGSHRTSLALLPEAESSPCCRPTFWSCPADLAEGRVDNSVVDTVIDGFLPPDVIKCSTHSVLPTIVRFTRMV